MARNLKVEFYAAKVAQMRAMVDFQSATAAEAVALHKGDTLEAAVQAAHRISAGRRLVAAVDSLIEISVKMAR